MSGEHYVSKSLLSGPGVKVAGLKWCTGSLRDISVKGLTANVLCKHHNEALSPLDQEIAKFRDAIQIWHNLPPRRRQAKNGCMRLDGTLLARWMAKTFCNLCAVDKRPLREDFERIAFSPQLAQNVCLGKPNLWSKAMLDPDHPVRFADFSAKSDSIVFMQLFGFPWILMNFHLKPGDLLYLPEIKLGPNSVRDFLWADREIRIEYDDWILTVTRLQRSSTV